MLKCCKCKKTVWLGQQSRISGSPIHKSCHEKCLEEYLIKNHNMREMFNAEISAFEKKTNILTDLKI